jgi:hypothetical protein
LIALWKASWPAKMLETISTNITETPQSPTYMPMAMKKNAAGSSAMTPCTAASPKAWITNHRVTV